MVAVDEPVIVGGTVKVLVPVIVEVVEALRVVDCDWEGSLEREPELLAEKVVVSVEVGGSVRVWLKVAVALHSSVKLLLQETSL